MSDELSGTPRPITSPMRAATPSVPQLSSYTPPKHMAKNDRLLNRAIVVMAIAALGTTALVVRRELAPVPPPPRYDQPQHVEGWQSFLRGGSRIGPADAPVTIIEFSDFQCEFCKVHAAQLDRLREAHPGQIAILFRHYPVTEQHPHAYNAALASECAGEQGKFEAYRDILFRNQARIGKTGWSEFARQAGVADLKDFGSCVSERRHARRIAADVKAGKKLGVPATPTLLINQWKVVGAPDEQKLDSLVEDALRSARRGGAGRGGDRLLRLHGGLAPGAAEPPPPVRERLCLEVVAGTALSPIGCFPGQQRAPERRVGRQIARFAARILPGFRGLEGPARVAQGRVRS